MSHTPLHSEPRHSDLPAVLFDGTFIAHVERLNLAFRALGGTLLRSFARLLARLRG